MIINTIVKSFVVDIRTDTPKITDSFLVDTNVWYWLTYTKASSCARPPRYYQINDYPDYISKAKSIKAKLLRCGLVLSELAHIIEISECELYNIVNNSQLKLKEFRHNYPTERAITVNEIGVAWSQVEAISDNRDITIDNTACNDLITLIGSSCVDGYDAFMALQEMKINPHFAVITDDGDYATIPGIHVFTANQRIIEIARKSGLLVKR
jgi:hypothetical protein